MVLMFVPLTSVLCLPDRPATSDLMSAPTAAASAVMRAWMLTGYALAVA